MDHKQVDNIKVELGIYNRPTVCTECGGMMIFKGVGEYRCEDCKHVQYDDYGKVRLYIETHKGATAAQIEDAIGVSQKAIRQMIREARLEIAPDSKAFLRCEICGISIRYGRYCTACEQQYHQQLETAERAKRTKKAKGFGMEKDNHDSGEKRFKRTL